MSTDEIIFYGYCIGTIIAFVVSVIYVRKNNCWKEEGAMYLGFYIFVASVFWLELAIILGLFVLWAEIGHLAKGE